MLALLLPPLLQQLQLLLRCQRLRLALLPALLSELLLSQQQHLLFLLPLCLFLLLNFT
jgi:hypothetical protein